MMLILFDLFPKPTLVINTYIGYINGRNVTNIMVGEHVHVQCITNIMQQTHAKLQQNRRRTDGQTS